MTMAHSHLRQHALVDGPDDDRCGHHPSRRAESPRWRCRLVSHRDRVIRIYEARNGSDYTPHEGWVDATEHGRNATVKFCRGRARRHGEIHPVHEPCGTKPVSPYDTRLGLAGSCGGFKDDEPAVQR